MPKRFKGNPEIAKSEIQTTDIFPIEHDIEATDQDKKIKVATLKEYINEEQNTEINSIKNNFIKFVEVATKPTITDMQPRVLYLVNSVQDVYQGYYLIEKSDGTKSIGQIGGRSYEGENGITVDSETAKISNDLVTSGGDINGNLDVKGTLEAQGDLTIKGNIYQEGDSYETHAEKLYTKKDVILTRENAESGLLENEYTGIKATHYNADGDNGLIALQKDGTLRIGDEDDLQPVATRAEESELTDKMLIKWNSEKKRIETIENLTEILSKDDKNLLEEKDDGIFLGADALDITDTVEKSNQNAVSSNAVYEYYQAEQNHNIPRKVMKDITAYYEDGTLWKRLNGTDGFSLFEDIFVGDYFKISRAITVQGSYGGEVGSDYVTIAGINTLQGNGDNTDMMYNHLVMVAGKGTEGKQHFGRRQMNSSNTTSGGYVGSAMYNTHIGGVASSGNVNGNINQQLYAEFGEHLKTTRELLSNSINASGYNRFGNAGGCSNNWSWYSCQAVLMSEVEVYGSIVWSSSGYDTGTANQQLPLFRFSPKAQNNRTAYYWLKDVASSAYFCYSNDSGYSDCYNASYDYDFVRPRFVIA